MEIESYSKRYARWKRIVVILILLCVGFFTISLSVGFMRIPTIHIIEILIREIPFMERLIPNGSFSEIERTIILGIRLPRVLASFLIGLSLASSGVVFQGIFRNPMADPFIIGVSSGAALGAALAIVLRAGIGTLGYYAIPVMAFLGSLLALFITYNISKVGSIIPITTLLLSGIAVSIFFSSIVAMLEVIAGAELHPLVFWLMGGFSYIEWRDVSLAFPLILLSGIMMYAFARDLNLMLLGDEEARHLGVSVEKTKKLLILFASLATATSVSLSGIIGFVGLIVPHITRILIGPDHRILIPASMLLGGIFLMICDALARIVMLPAELPVGIITALSGGPFFIYLLRKKKGSYAM
ncbi:MAG: iron chelate uptake ABC transporter family permease subunit [Candidatus Bathyarchaeia archaeon]